MSWQMSITQVAAKAMRAAIQAIAAPNAENSTRQSVEPKVGRLMMKQTTFNWDTEDTCNELKNFRSEVNNVLKSYNIPDIEKIAIIKNWLGRKGLQLLETLTQAEQDKCKTTKELFITLNSKLKP